MEQQEYEHSKIAISKIPKDTDTDRLLDELLLTSIMTDHVVLEVPGEEQLSIVVSISENYVAACAIAERIKEHAVNGELLSAYAFLFFK